MMTGTVTVGPDAALVWRSPLLNDYITEER